ncbi:MAG: putative glycoside hydrolase [Candidatus Falkowbacteria bacterium]
MKKVATILILFCLLIPSFTGLASDKNPKLINYFLHWSITESEARELSKWDFLVLDMEVQENSPSELRLIRQLNPRVKIIAYISSQNLFDADFNSNESVLRKKLAEGVADSWWLRDESGNRLSDWPNAYVLNITDFCGSNSNGQKFNEYLPEFVSSNIMGTGLWDGVFYDNVWSGASWFNQGNVSLAGNGKRNSTSELDTAWRNGVRSILNRTRKLLPKAIIVANGSFIWDYQNYLNGWMLEDFPTPWENGGTWSGVMQSYLKLSNNSQSYHIINAVASNPNDYTRFRYGLASALLGDAYYSFDYGSQNHAQFWWYDEYDNDLGSKQSVAYNLLDKTNATIKPGLWRRDYTGGIAIVNSTDKEQSYVFTKEEFDRIRGTQDPAVNNGQKVNSVKILPHDGLILLKRPTVIRNNWFVNGNFFRIFNDSGSQIRNGFFAYVDSYQGSQPLLFHDFSGRGEEQIISVSKGILTLISNGKKTLSFKPYGAFKGNFSIAAGDTRGDEQEEIITGAGAGGGPQVMVFDLKGKLKFSFMAYDKNFRGGVNIAVGDLNGDSKAEIVTGAGAGGGPQVRIFDASGKAKTSFMAYSQNFKGGVNVAVGDVDGDGQNEIITGEGKGGDSQVKIWSGSGQLKSSFMAYDKTYRNGVFVAASDINNDSKAEILTGISGF